MVLYWSTDDLLGSDVERSYGAHIERERDWHDWVELGERVADALAAENDGAAPHTTPAVA